MGSLGGLDVAFGSQMQLVRTNVLVIETDATTTKAMAETVHSIASQKYPAALRPDFTAFVADGVLTEGYATELTDQVEGNVLKDITAVPMAGSTYGSTSDSRGMSWEAILLMTSLPMLETPTTLARCSTHPTFKHNLWPLNSRATKQGLLVTMESLH